MSIFDINKKQIIRYAVMPEILPRLQNFFQGGFIYLAVFMAEIYRAVRLLPANHPFLKREAMGSFHVFDVIAAASENLQFKVKYIDQIIIFFALILGMIMLLMQFLLLLVALLIGSASAAEMPDNYKDFFNTPNPAEDIAFRMLDSVFGVEGLFGSKEAIGTDYHLALQGLFQFYSVGLLVVAGIVIAYFIFVVLAETAQTGTPFGKRYNHAWVPIRLIIGIGLLIPIGSGFNAAQWITLYSAKMGSGVATVGWNKFNEEVNNQFIEADKTVAAPEVPDLRDLAAFMMVAQACRHAYWELDPSMGSFIEPYVLHADNKAGSSPMPGLYKSAAGLANQRTIKIVFGIKNAEQYKDEPGQVRPYCGRIDMVVPETTVGSGTMSPANLINSRFYNLILEMWNNNFEGMETAARYMILSRLFSINRADPSADLKYKIIEEAKDDIRAVVNFAVSQLQKEVLEDDELEKYGWAGAGLWYNRIANVNGKLTNAVMNKPQVVNYPLVMKQTCKEKKKNEKNVDGITCMTSIKLSGGKEIKFASETDKKIAVTLGSVFKYWYAGEDGVTKNVFVDVINAILGTEGIFDMCKNADIHPLAQLSVAGKGLVEAAIRNVGFSVAGGLSSILPYLGPATSAAGGFFGALSSIGLLIGFILYYMVPLMPFLYFFFAVGTWVRGIFEAMVGVPLWALAHLRIDGEGLAGSSASGGYYLIFEIFIRPILILFGLIASVLIFAAMIKVLNEVFHLVATNLAGFNGESVTDCGATAGSNSTTSAAKGTAEYYRGPIDQLFFTVLYAIIVYLTGMSCFKLIDMIPNQIMRWLGDSTPTFGDDAGQVAESVMTKVAVGGHMLGGQLGGIAQGFSGTITGTAQGVVATYQKHNAPPKEGG